MFLFVEERHQPVGSPDDGTLATNLSVHVGPGAVRPQLLQPDRCSGDEPAE